MDGCPGHVFQTHHFFGVWRQICVETRELQVADVVARNTMGASLPLIAELGALTVVLIVFLQLGAAVRNDRLASTDFFLEAVAVRRTHVAAGFRALWDLAGAAICFGIA